MLSGMTRPCSDCLWTDRSLANPHADLPLFADVLQGSGIPDQAFETTLIFKMCTYSFKTNMNKRASHSTILQREISFNFLSNKGLEGMFYSGENKMHLYQSFLHQKLFFRSKIPYLVNFLSQHFEQPGTGSVCTVHHCVNLQPHSQFTYIRFFSSCNFNVLTARLCTVCCLFC